MEIEYFIPPGESEWQRHHQEWINVRKLWFSSIGLTEDCLGEEVHPQDKLAHYARACTDITFKFPFGEHELEGIAARGNFDLTQHQEHSGKSLEYFDENLKEKFLPHVIEPSLGVDRTFLAVLARHIQLMKSMGKNELYYDFVLSLPPLRQEFFPLLKISLNWLR